jgi:hypothetical protein
MENPNPTPFDLERELRGWRTNLLSLKALSTQDVEELETHLRESMADLRRQGLSPEEAFLIASRRLGRSEQLAEEYAKTHPHRVWLDRVLWMVLGLLALDALSMSAWPFYGAVLDLARLPGLSAHLVGAVTFLIKWTVFAACGALGLWIMTRHGRWLSRLGGLCLRRPVWSGVGLVVALKGLELLAKNAHWLWASQMHRLAGASAAQPISQQKLAILNGWLLWCPLLTQLLWVIAVPLLAAWLWRANRQALPSGSAGALDGLGPNKGKVVQELQARGLSPEEAALVVARRQAPVGTSTSDSDESSVRRLRLGRGLWMITGAVVSALLQPFELMPLWVLRTAAHSPSPLAQHLWGLASICLGVILAAAIIAAVSSFETGRPRQSKGLRGFFRFQSFIATVALLALYAGAQAVLWFVETTLPPGGIIPLQWSDIGYVLDRLVIPGALVVWFARRGRFTVSMGLYVGAWAILHILARAFPSAPEQAPFGGVPYGWSELCAALVRYGIPAALLVALALRRRASAQFAG